MRKTLTHPLVFLVLLALFAGMSALYVLRAGAQTAGWRCYDAAGATLFNACFISQETCNSRCAALATGAECALDDSCNSFIDVTPSPTPADSPGICTQIYAPVCGTDGRTYPSECYAHAVNVGVAYTGECRPDASPVPTETGGTQPTPTPVGICTNNTGYASSCWQDGSRIVNVLQPTVTDSSISFNVVVKMPVTASMNAIWNRAYYWSNTLGSWRPVTLIGVTYPGTTLSSTGGYLTNTAATSVTVPTADAISGTVYLVTWDYTYQSGTWTGPSCAFGSTSNFCWRVQSIPVL